MDQRKNRTCNIHFRHDTKLVLDCTEVSRRSHKRPLTAEKKRCKDSRHKYQSVTGKADILHKNYFLFCASWMEYGANLATEPASDQRTVTIKRKGYWRSRWPPSPRASDRPR